MTRTIVDVVASTSAPARAPLPAPKYDGLEKDRTASPSCAFMVESMRRHMTDEGYQLALALGEAGYFLAGYGFDFSPDVLDMLDLRDPLTVVLQDKREWTGRTAGPGFDQRERFTNVGALQDRDDVFKLTVLKDAHSDHPLHVEAATEMGCHGWVVYYHPDIVAAQAPFVRREHLVRTWHSVDADIVPKFSPVRMPAGLVSGALSKAYPLRSRLALAIKNHSTHNMDVLVHPGYRRDGCHTADYLERLSKYKVAVCTSSRFGYAVRKIVEATACGCVVVTDLPTDEHLPEIDGNLIRVHPDASPGWVDELVHHLCVTWDADRQRVWADRAKRFYDYRALGRRLADDIESLRSRYNG